MTDYNLYFNIMPLHEKTANLIWQIREELGIPGSEKMDWYFAELYLDYFGEDWVFYDAIYRWLMENIDDLEKDYFSKGV